MVDLIIILCCFKRVDDSWEFCYTPCTHLAISVTQNAGVVQLVECLLAKEKVVGSNPIARSVYGQYVFYGDVAKWQGKGLQNPHHGFKSHRRLTYESVKGFILGAAQNPIVASRTNQSRGSCYITNNWPVWTHYASYLKRPIFDTVRLP
jgi:hypothetical protein